MIGLNLVYAAAGIAFAAFALLGLRARRPANAGFHALLAGSFWLGDRIGDLGNGVLVLALVALASSGRMRAPTVSTEAPLGTGAATLPLALVIPAVALAGTLAFKQMPTLVDPKQATLVALTAGVLLTLAWGYLVLRPAPLLPFEAGRTVADAVGWAIVLPQMLASLGAVFALAGVGGVVGALATHAIPDGSVAGAVIVYLLGMALFTTVMGNAFAAFPVMVAGVGVPLLVARYGANPAPVAAIGMLAGFCGTLLTPMAANFNLVPAALLELRNRYGVIRAQAPTALALLAVNIFILWLAVR